jgi:excinuclease ABC subunit B
MRAAAADLEFEEAARLRDEIRRLEAFDLGLATAGRPQARSVAGQPGSRARDDAKRRAAGRKKRG